jgi:endonuclease VIII
MADPDDRWRPVDVHRVALGRLVDLPRFYLWSRAGHALSPRRREHVPACGSSTRALTATSPRTSAAPWVPPASPVAYGRWPRDHEDPLTSSIRRRLPAKCPPCAVRGVRRRSRSQTPARANARPGRRERVVEPRCQRRGRLREGRAVPASRSGQRSRPPGRSDPVDGAGEARATSTPCASSAWGVDRPGRRWGRSPHRAWLVLRVGGVEVVQFEGPVLELMTTGRTRFDQRLAGLGPEVLADTFDRDRFLARLRGDDPTRPIGDALLDQRTVAGIWNMWKAEGCWEAQVDPWRAVRDVSDAEAVAIVEGMRPRMLSSAVDGPRSISHRVHGKPGQPCPRCGTRIRSRGQGDDNRTTCWCPGCQS